jgi:CheY-like chemotaxis protein
MNVTPGSAPKKILIVDDDNDDSSLFCEALKEVGPATICYIAEDGNVALEKLSNREIECPDIIFLDLNMPVMDGWEFLNRLKSMEKFKDIPVIIHTTSAQRLHKKQAMAMGALCFVTKLYDFKELKYMLSIVIDKLSLNATETICETIHSQLGLN